MTLPVHLLALAAALAGVAGLRAFVPLFFLCHALRLDLIGPRQVNPNLLQFSNDTEATSTYAMLGFLALAEICIQKIPAVLRYFDLPFLLLRAVSAVISAFAVLPIADFGTGLTAAIVLGAIGAIPIMNLHASQHYEGHGPQTIQTTASMLVDGLSFGVCSIALQLPYVGLGALHVGMWLIIAFTNMWRRRQVHSDTVQGLVAPPELPENWQRPAVSPPEPRRRPPSE